MSFEFINWYWIYSANIEEHTSSYMYTCIGYKLPTFGDYMSVASGQLPPGQVPDQTTSPRTNSWGEVDLNRQVPGGQLPPGQCVSTLELVSLKHRMFLSQLGVHSL